MKRYRSCAFLESSDRLSWGLFRIFAVDDPRKRQFCGVAGTLLSLLNEGIQVQFSQPYHKLSFKVSGLPPLMIPNYHRIPNLNFLMRTKNEERRSTYSGAARLTAMTKNVLGFYVYGYISFQKWKNNTTNN